MRGKLPLVLALLVCSCAGDNVPGGTTASVGSSTSAGSGTSVVTSPDVGTSPNAEVASHGLEASCADLVFPNPDPLSLPDESSLPDEPVDSETQAIIDEAAASVGMEGAMFEAYQWFAVERSESELTVFGKGEVTEDGPQYGYARLEFKDGRWNPASWGGCQVEVVSPGYGNARWVLSPDHEPMTSDDQLSILINERNCASGQPPTDRDVLPVVFLRPERVAITVLVEPVAGVAECPSNPWHPMSIDLGEALDGRPLFDGSEVPAVERTWPPPEDLMSVQ